MIDVHTWRIEVGERAMMHTQTLPRDMRWWYGVWERRRSWKQRNTRPVELDDYSERLRVLDRNPRRIP